MKNKDFEQLVESIKQAGWIKKCKTLKIFTKKSNSSELVREMYKKYSKKFNYDV